MNSIVQNGGNWDITATLCIGAGVTGFVQGADQLTSTMAAFFYGPAGSPVTVLASGPAAITSTFRGCTMIGIPNGGPIDGCFSPDPCGPPYFNPIDDAVWLTDNFCDFAPPCLAPCDLGFTCILTTALCGNVHQDCFPLTFTTDIRPDSIRIVGAEGAGQAFSGCYPNPDMRIDLTTLPVIFGDFTAQSQKGANVLDWSTIMETNSERFEILRSEDGGEFTVIGTHKSLGNGESKRDYHYVDMHPLLESNYYKIRQVDADGATMESKVIEIGYEAPASLAWESVGPVPTNSTVNINFVSEKSRSMSLVLTDMEGKVVHSEQVNALTGLNSLVLDLSNKKSGVYLLRINGADAKLTQKLIKF